MYFSLIIPAYNEEYRIENVIKTYGDYFSEHLNDRFEMIVIVNNSSDKTIDVVKDLAKKHSYLRVEDFSYYTGKGGAIIEGFKLAKGDLIGFVDSDLALLPDQYKKLLNIGDFDVTIASRWITGANILNREDWKVVLAGRAYNKLVRLFFGLNVYDTQCGGKVFKKAIVDKIIPLIKVKGFGIDLDLLYKSKLVGAKIKEIPITWSHVEEDSKTNLVKSTTTMFKELFITRFG